MSAVFTEAFYHQLRNDAELVSMLATYNGLPAIFTVDPVPGDAVLPYIVTAGSVADTSWDTTYSEGRIIVRDIRCYTAATGSMIAVENMAERVRHLFHRRRIPIDGYDNVITKCTGPIEGPEEDDAYGMIVTVEMHLFRL